MKKTKRAIDDIYERDAKGDIIGEKPEVRNKPGHHSGPRGDYGSPGYGYELNHDGSYSLAPAQRDTFDDISAKIESIHSLCAYVFDHAQKQLSDLDKRRSKWFREAAATVYRLDEIISASYDPSTGRLTFKAAAPSSKRLEEEIELDKAGAGKKKEDRI